MARYLALLRGINVGGNTMLSMSALKSALEKSGLSEVKTYINSGNVFFSSTENDQDQLAKLIEDCIATEFDLEVPVVVFSKTQWHKIIEQAPEQWGNDPSRKHNLIVLLRPFDMDQVLSTIGAIKPDIETLQAGEGVIYQSLSLELFGKTTSGKLAGNPIYKRMTIRNFNTSQKLLAIFCD